MVTIRRNIDRGLFIFFLFILLPFSYKAYAAPPLPAKGLYVNDYSTVLFSEHRELFMETSAGFSERYGVEIVVITVKDIEGGGLADFAGAIYSRWFNLNFLGTDVVMILYCSGTQEWDFFAFGRASAYFNDELAARISDEFKENIAKSNSSNALSESYKHIARVIFAENELRGEAFPKVLEANTVSDDRSVYNSAIISVLALAIGLRGLFVSRKYQKKYLHRKAKRREKQKFTRTAFDDDHKADIVDIDD